MLYFHYWMISSTQTLKQYGIETLAIHESKQQANKILSETAFGQSLTASAVFISQIYTSSSLTQFMFSFPY